MNEPILHPRIFIRHRRQLRAFLLDDQAWFCARDLGRLMNQVLERRVCSNLDPDQYQQAWFRDAKGELEQGLLISESGLYAALIYYFHPEHRSLRRWLTHEVVLALRSEFRGDSAQPRRRSLCGDGTQVSVLEWQGRLWVPYAELPKVANLR
ncbi:phage antirepressor [Pseudomonas sp. A46]|nr:Bro-N domain-containing protein [Pseudomonas sp. A46]OWJ95411.1 phage antirepressor [Pseudomonas sp. A46]